MAHSQVWDNFLQLMKNAFYFTQEALRRQGIQIFALTFWSYRKTTWLERQGYFKIPDVIIWFRNNCNTLVDQYLMKYAKSSNEILSVNRNNMRNIFLKKSNTKCIDKLFQDPFGKIQNWVYLRISCIKFDTVWFYCMPSWGLSKNIETEL